MRFEARSDQEVVPNNFREVCHTPIRVSRFAWTRTGDRSLDLLSVPICFSPFPVHSAPGTPRFGAASRY